jgi:hypothetical protein
MVCVAEPVFPAVVKEAQLRVLTFAALLVTMEPAENSPSSPQPEPIS